MAVYETRLAILLLRQNGLAAHELGSGGAIIGGTSEDEAAGIHFFKDVFHIYPHGIFWVAEFMYGLRKITMQSDDFAQIVRCLCSMYETIEQKQSIKLGLVDVDVLADPTRPPRSNHH